MEQNEKTNLNRQSKIQIINNYESNFYGVDKVISCTENVVSIIFAGEPTIIEGNNLHITNLDIEGKTIILQGKICNLKIGKKQSSKKFFKNLFS